VAGPAVAIIAMLLAGAEARAGNLPDTSNLDGQYLWLGPTGAGVHVGGAWDGSFGAAAAWIDLHEHRALSLTGVLLEAIRYSARDGGRVSLEAMVGTKRLPAHFLVGASLGAAVELAQYATPRAGVTASLWGFGGVEPYLRGGWLAQTGTFVEIGLAIALPLHHWRR
jgi:hypothetical protein